MLTLLPEQIWFDMQMATDYKRCSIFISDTRVLALAESLVNLKALFMEPVQDFRVRDRLFRPYRCGLVRSVSHPFLVSLDVRA